MSEAVKQSKRRYTVAEYLAMEETALERHEYHDGAILAMSGGTYAHGSISTNLIGALWQRLRGKPCQPKGSDVRVRWGVGARYVYPDVSIVCGEPIFDPDDTQPRSILNPRTVIEVLSDSTKAYDRGDKFEGYRTIASLQEYVIVAQDRPLVETFNRQADGSWRLDTYGGLDAAAQFRSMDLELPLSEIYLGIVFPPLDISREPGGENAPDRLERMP